MEKEAKLGICFNFAKHFVLIEAPALINNYIIIVQ